MKVLVYHRRWNEYCPILTAQFPELCVVGGYSSSTLAAHADTGILLAWDIPLDWLEGASNLRWFQVTSAGVEHLLPAKAHLERVAVTNTRGIHADLMADFAMTAISMAQWDVPRLLRNQAARRWEPRSTMPLAGQTLGVLGLGAIGQEIARRGLTAGMRVLGARRNPCPVDGVSRVFAASELSAMLPECDFIVVVVPWTPDTRLLIGRAELALMKETAFLINIARAGVIDESALVDVLRQRRIAGAVLDVFNEEPLPPDSALWALDNVVVTPHISGEPADYVRRATEIFADNYHRWRAGQSLRNLVDFNRGY